MTIRNTTTGWGLASRLLHWSMAALILFMLLLGFYTANLVTDVYVQFGWVQIHKSWGFVAFTLAVLRLGWRAVNPTPAPVPGMAPLAHLASQIAHRLLYLLMFAMPITGWLMASASPLQDSYGIKNMVFGWFELPDPFVPGSAELTQAFGLAHLVCAIALVTILAVHAGAALKHHLIDRDTVLRRMIRGA